MNSGIESNAIPPLYFEMKAEMKIIATAPTSPRGTEPINVKFLGNAPKGSNLPCSVAASPNITNKIIVTGAEIALKV
jgi:hypothetical protein